MVKTFSEPKLVQDILVFISFANIYWRFIQGFNKIAVSFTSILNTNSDSSKTQQMSKLVSVDDEVKNDSYGGQIKKLAKFKNVNKIKKSRKIRKNQKIS